jgi:L-idonate 5-dehydrogenase
MAQSYSAAVLQSAGEICIEQRTTEPIGPGEVRIRLGCAGICGTDLHYYRDFANAGFPLAKPVVLGHEANGTIVEVGDAVQTLDVGDRVVVDPLMACGECPSCRRGRRNLCERKRYPGSATTTPHIDGFFRELFVAPAQNCHRVPADASLAELALVEPFACALHGVAQAGRMLGRRVLVTGAGPIGTLAASAAMLAGAADVVLADIIDEPLAIARQMGVPRTVNLSTQSFEELVAAQGAFDVAIEASGAAVAFGNCLRAVRRGGTVVQLGILPSEASCPANLIMLRELTIRGSSQYVDEFEAALTMIYDRRLDVRPMITHRFAVADAAEALRVASDRRRSMKVQIVLGEEL